MPITPKFTLPKGATPKEIFKSIQLSRGIEVNPKPPTLESLIQGTGITPGVLARTKAVVMESIKKDEDILVYGDYDADGLTATTIMWTTLRGLAKNSKARVLPFIPDRTRHGYGLSDRSLNDIFSKKAFSGSAYPGFNPSLIITVDTGIVANQEIQKLIDSGIKVVVTDHHEPATSLPPATCIVHTTTTSGAGVSWLTSLYLASSHQAVYSMVDVATVGIVADQMPLTGVNRAIVIEGLKMLTRTKNVGLNALKQLAGMGERAITTYDISFGLAPRLNAVGRLDNAMDGLRLLCTRDKQVALRLATAIESHNKNRQELTDKMVEEALKSPVEHKLIFVASKNYHEGVIGLVAGKLAEKYHRPAVVVAIREANCKGSARSVSGINITDILREHTSLLESVGGHEQAAGFSLKESNLQKLEKKLTTYADKSIDDKFLKKSYTVDCFLPLDSCTKELAILLNELEPFGLGNPKPKFALQEVTVTHTKPLSEGKHHKLTIEKGGTTKELIWFNSNGGNNLTHIKELIFSLDINSWQGRENLQLIADYVQV